jgi:type IV secretory pathway TraG/TraD family ATPase VirD4
MEELHETTVTSAGQLHADKRREPLLSAEELLALKPDEVIIFTPRTNPMKLKAITWRDFERETDERRYCPPPRPALKVNDRLSCYELEENREVWGVGVNQQMLPLLSATLMQAATAKARTSAEAVVSAEADRKAEVAAAKQQPKTYPDPANIIHEIYANDEELLGGWGMAC